MKIPHIAPTKENICAVFVTYYPDDGFPKRVALLSPQVAHYIIIDNTPASDASPCIEKAKKENPSGEVVRNRENFGLAKGLNQGIQLAEKLGYLWLLTMDQDSEAALDMVSELLKAHNTATRENMHVDLIGVNLNYRGTKHFTFDRQCGGLDYIKKMGIQTSGSLFSLSMYKRIGPFREDFFIDYIDTEYCLRLKRAGFQSIIACRAHMLHSIGNTKKYSVTIHYNALRRYYRTRNGFTLLKEYAFKEPWWVIKKIGWALLGLPLIFLWEKNRGQKIKNFFVGIKDSIQKKGGKSL